MKRLRLYAVLPFLMQSIFWLPAWILAKTCARFTVQGVDYLLKVKGPIIFVANHPNQIDPVFVRLAVPWFSRFSPMFWLARDRKTYGWEGWRKYVLTDSFFLAWGAPIAPSGLKNYAKALAQHVRVIYDGYSFNMFPQAGNEKYMGLDAPIHGGVAYLAHATGATLIPTAIVGTSGFTVMRLLFGQTRVRVAFGEPISVESLKLMGDEEVTLDEYKAAAREIMSKVYFLKNAVEAEIGFRAHIPHHPELAFEYNSILKSLLNYITVPLLNLLPASLRETTKRTHEKAREVIDNKTTYKALEILYMPPNAPRPKEPFLKEVFYFLWFTTNNSKAVRNRLKLVKHELKRACEKVLSTGDLELLSIASGSARADIEMLASLTIPPGRKARVTFLDKDPRSLEYSKRLTATFAIENRYEIRWIEDTASGFIKHFTDSKPNVIEMVGLLDYFDDQKSEHLFSLIHEHMAIGGTFVTGNIADNSERAFVTNLVGWKMIYRPAEKVADLLVRAGFLRQNVHPYYEPLRIQSVVVAQKIN